MLARYRGRKFHEDREGRVAANFHRGHPYLVGVSGGLDAAWNYCGASRNRYCRIFS